MQITFCSYSNIDLLPFLIVYWHSRKLSILVVLIFPETVHFYGRTWHVLLLLNIGAKNVIRLSISNCLMFLWTEERVNGSQIKKTISVRDTVYSVNLERITSGSIFQILSESLLNSSVGIIKTIPCIKEFLSFTRGTRIQ